MIRTVIIDDDLQARERLKSLLSQVSHLVVVVGEGIDVASGLNIIANTQPELIFLDVQLGGGTGFDILDQVSNLEAEVIFITNYDQYAIRAFEFAAFGYLLKPLQLTELRAVLSRLETKIMDQKNTDNSRVRVLVDRQKGEGIQKLVVQDVHGFRVMALSDIVYLKGEVNYSNIFSKDGQQLLTSKTLKEYEKMLEDFGFFRIHQSYLINLGHVNSYHKGDGGQVFMSNGDTLDVSRRKKASFLQQFLG